MSIITSHELARFYERYHNTEVTFTKQVVEATGLLTQAVFVKVAGGQWPCVMYATSMTGAKLIVTVRRGFSETLQKANGHLSLHLAFRRPDKPDPISLFVPGRVSGLIPYNPQNPEVQLLSLEFGSRPSDDLIQALGILLEANTNARRRREERIPLTPDTLKRLGLESRECRVTIAGTPHKCILRDVSFSGAKVLVGGIDPSVAGQPVGLTIARGESSDEITLRGEVVRTEEVLGHADILALGIRYLGEPPVTYKILISGYLSSVRRTVEPPPSPAQQGGKAPGG